MFRRDQVWFTEKNPEGATDLYSLQDIKGVRSEDPREKGYFAVGMVRFRSSVNWISRNPCLGQSCMKNRKKLDQTLLALVTV